MSGRFAYPCTLAAHDDGSWTASFRDFDGQATQARSRDGALIEARDLLESLVAFWVADGKPLPVPARAGPDDVIIAPSTTTAAQLALHLALRDGGLSRRALSDLIAVPEAEVDRLLDLRRSPSMAKLDRALAALGRRITVAVEAAE